MERKGSNVKNSRTAECQPLQKGNKAKSKTCTCGIDGFIVWNVQQQISNSKSFIHLENK